MLIFVLLLNLQVITSIDGVSVGFSCLYAQTFGNEYLDNIDIPGSSVPCVRCGERYFPSEEQKHDSECSMKLVACDQCGRDVLRKDLSDHGCVPLDGTVGTDECPFCHKTLYNGESCTCSGWISSNSGGGGSSHPSGPSSGGGYGGGSSAKQNDTQYKVLIERLRNLLSIWVNKISLIESNINKLMQGGIFIPDEKVSNPNYNLKDDKIHIPIDESWFSMETVNHEALHYFQNQQQMLDYDRCSSNVEFQAYIINYLIFACKGEYTAYPWELEDSDLGSLVDKGYIGVNNDGDLYYKENLVVELEKMNLNVLCKSYYENNKRKGLHGSNSHSYDPNYNWNWDSLLNCIGLIKIK